MVSGDDPINIVAAGAYGALISSSPGTNELEGILQQLLQDDSDTSVRQAKSTALAVALKSNCGLIFSEQHKDKIAKGIIGLFSSDKVPIVCNGIRTVCHIVVHCVRNNEEIPLTLLQPFAKSLNNQNNEVKIVMGQASELIGRLTYPASVPKDMFKAVIPALVMGTKEKNSIVRASCESALVYLLHLRQADNVLSDCLEALGTGAGESLNDVVSKVLRKSLSQSEGREPDIDDSILS